MDIDKYLKSLYLPSKSSHKGQNGRLMIIGGSKLFHSASLWSLTVASRIVDLVHYASVPENNRIVEKLNEEFRDGIVVSRKDIEYYIEEDDVILIGPGMCRADKLSVSGYRLPVTSLNNILDIEDEGVQTYYITKYLLKKYPEKKWVIDAGALQMLEPEWIPKNAILTPHKRELAYFIKKISNFKFLISNEFQMTKFLNDKKEIKKVLKHLAVKYQCVIILKGEKDYIEDEFRCEEIIGGNAGMTKGGTGDVLAGLVAALYCKNDAYSSSVCASYINKKAGEELYEKMGYWFNASDLADQIPKTMKKLILNK
jgi:hydroxyethylthiazole kinase-like uncharacterized protein yjeF